MEKFDRKPSGIEDGQRKLFGVQTTGRTYRNLSEPTYEILADYNVPVLMRDGIHLHTDIFRPDSTEKFPALIAISPYPRQLQNIGVPAGFMEAGQTDFFVPRGYAHVIANNRGTCGSEGVFDLWGLAEQHDLYDLIEWAAVQPWCNGRVGMIGVSYFAIEQFRAAIQAPPHLRAIFPFSGTVDIYRELAWPGGIFSGRFMSRFFNALGMLSRKSEDFFRSTFFELINKILLLPWVHERVAAPHKDPLKALELAMRFSYEPHPWDDLFYQFAIEHPFYDEFWASRNLTEKISDIKIPLYIGADWENVCVHLKTPFSIVNNIQPNVPYRMSITPRGSLQWPWETLHIEALAWYDHWLKNNDTGIMEGPAIRYYLEGADEWRTSDVWPLPETKFTNWYLQASGKLGDKTEKSQSRDYMYLPKSMDLPKNANPPPLPGLLSWDTEPFNSQVDLIGPFKLKLHAASTATDVDWIIKLQIIDNNGKASDLTQGWLRASHRALDAELSKPYLPHHPHTKAVLLTPHKPTWFEIAIVPTAQRFKSGERLRVLLTSEDKNFAMQGIHHTGLGLPSRNTVYADSTLMVPVIE